MAEIDSVFTKEYQAGTKTESDFQQPVLQGTDSVPEIEIETKRYEIDKIEIEAKRYGIDKPRRVVVRAKITHDQD